MTKVLCPQVKNITLQKNPTPDLWTILTSKEKKTNVAQIT